jgi:hypothetical protein
LALVVTASLVACSGKGTDTSGESVVTPPEHLISSADIAKTAPNSAERAFLRYWSNLQSSAWSAALASFEPGLVNAITVPRLIEALKTGATYFPTVAPTLRPSVRVGDQIIVRYRLPSAAGAIVTSSVSWRRTSAGWRIHYYPALDAMLQASTQAQVQASIDPNATEPSKQAVQAGLAASRIQSQYLRRQTTRR